MELVRAIQFLTSPDVVQTDAALYFLHIFSSFIGVLRIRSDNILQLAYFENELAPLIELENVSSQSSQVINDFAK